ncbi:hypothetical protein [Thermostaphylospora chromogena]|uniref:Uncharacterized protein n=1 Tax=Thermostaphylospora chromogena TaxID=35622 RepID=A0A1H1GUI3_9ACTN|nr:hypothetical protein [Thermostaphylospora chromogena]SDR16578.1 hypothetical protein SAMN04489764_3814 [Thermostaphylospora chromogena]
MADRAVLQEMERVLDEVFGERERVALRDVYARASAHVNLPADMLAHLKEVPEGSYTRADIAEAINGVIRRRGEQDALGLLDVPADLPAANPAEGAAARDDTP